MGDGDDGAAVGAQVFLQPGHRPYVQVVGGFVQEEQFGGGRQDAGEGQPGLFAAGEGGERTVPGEVGEAEAVEGGFGPGVGAVAVALLVGGEEVSVRGEFRLRRVARRQSLLGRADGPFQGAEFGQGGVDDVLHGVGRVEGEGLGEIAGGAGEADGDLTAVRLLGPGQQTQEGGLAGAVLADDGCLLAGADGERHLVEYGAVPVRLGDVLHGQLGAFALGVHGCLFPDSWVPGPRWRVRGRAGRAGRDVGVRTTEGQRHTDDGDERGPPGEVTGGAVLGGGRAGGGLPVTSGVGRRLSGPGNQRK